MLIISSTDLILYWLNKFQACPSPNPHLGIFYFFSRILQMQHKGTAGSNTKLYCRPWKFEQTTYCGDETKGTCTFPGIKPKTKNVCRVQMILDKKFRVCIFLFLSYSFGNWNDAKNVNTFIRACHSYCKERE